MSEEGERIAKVESGLLSLEKTVDKNHQESMTYLKDVVDRMSKQHFEHYEKAEIQGNAITSLKTTIMVLKWVIGTGIPTAIGLGIFKFIGK